MSESVWESGAGHILVGIWIVLSVVALVHLIWHW